MHRRRYHVLVVVVFGTVGQGSGWLWPLANNPEVSLVGLTDHTLFTVRGFQYGSDSKSPRL